MNTSPDMRGKPGVNPVEMMKIALLSNAIRMNAYVQKNVMVSPDENAPPLQKGIQHFSPPSTAPSVARRTSPATAANTLYVLVLLEPCLGHAADARRVEVCLLGLDAAQAAQLLVALLLPLCDEHGVGVAVLEQPVVQLPADGLLVVVELVDVAAALVGDLEDGPLRLVSR